jgi:signal transduction histidine kinase
MADPLPLAAGAELADAVFQVTITAGLALFAVILHRWLRERWLAWWAGAWTLYLVRLLAIVAFLRTGDLAWLFWHQVITGWVALAILWAALVFSRDARWRAWYLAFAAFPLVLGWIAVNGLDRFVLVAIPMVALLSGATLWTGWVFWRHANRTGSLGSRFVAVAFALWGLHHLDYPFLRARGAWAPWGYFLDVLFELAVGVGFGLMVLTDLAARLAERREELTRLQSRLVRAEEAERRRLARELHDESAQTFSAVRLEVGLLREAADAPTRLGLDRVLELVDRGIGGIRRVINDLRPALLDDLGLLPAIRALADEVTSRGGPAITVDLPERLPSLGDEAELALFRATQEALSNVLRHAAAAEAAVTVTVDGSRVAITVADRGRGFPTGTDLATFEREGRLGLVGMRERIGALGGSVTVSGRDGVTVRVEVPVAHP